MSSPRITARHLNLGAVAIAGLLSGCADNGAATPPGLPRTYAFESRFAPGESGVDHGGQTFRHVLLLELKAFMTGLTAAIDAERLAPAAPGELLAALDSYFAFDGDTRGAERLSLVTDPPLLQAVWSDLGAGRTLVEKVAGNDAVTDWQDFTGGAFAGWSDPEIARHGGRIDSPEGLIRAFFATLEAQAIARVNGETARAAASEELPVHVTPDGLDLAELTHKFTTCAVAFHQGADDYLDDDLAGKGLLSSNLLPAGDAPRWTELEHAWDEGFGYFGAARDFADYADAEVAGAGGRDGWSRGWHDTDGDGAIDLASEYNFGHAVNAAKRDLGARTGGETDFTGAAFEAFLAGRTLIHAAAGRELSAAELTELKAHRDAAIGAWERAIAASALHYINATLALLVPGHPDYSHVKLAKAWSELKGFTLCSQFNPHSSMSSEAFATLHGHIGDAPVLAAAGEAAVEAYREQLRQARALIAEVWGFPAANVGDADGANGW